MGLCLKGCSLINNHCAIDLQKEIEVGALNYWGGSWRVWGGFF